jgi:predicted nuclease with TOPRIM domain
MTQNIDNAFSLELLKRIQADVAHIRERMDDHHQQIIYVREQINGLQGEIIRLDKHFSQRLDRIERRLELADTE